MNNSDFNNGTEWNMGQKEGMYKTICVPTTKIGDYRGKRVIVHVNFKLQPLWKIHPCATREDLLYKANTNEANTNFQKDMIAVLDTKKKKSKSSWGSSKKIEILKMDQERKTKYFEKKNKIADDDL